MARKKELYEKFREVRDGYRSKLKLITGKPEADSALAEDLSGYLKDTAQQLREWRGKKASGYFTRKESKEINYLYREIVALKRECDSKKHWMERALEIYERMKKGD